MNDFDNLLIYDLPKKLINQLNVSNNDRMYKIAVLAAVAIIIIIAFTESQAE
jgi:hypothetical protein